MISRIAQRPYRFTPTHVGTSAHLSASSRDDRRFTPTHVGTSPMRRLCRVSDGGSPPRTWGLRYSYMNYWQIWRFTPTHVGTSNMPTTIGRSDMRFTPTHVGTSIYRLRAALLEQVHPHARGDFRIVHRVLTSASGSPPRTWGLPLMLDERVPARTGSPPRTWGLLARLCRRCRRCRFTPTHVGTSRVARPVRCRSTGSPPRTWGLLSLLKVPRHPAQVHPHARGDFIYIRCWHLR